MAKLLDTGECKSKTGGETEERSNANTNANTNYNSYMLHSIDDVGDCGTSVVRMSITPVHPPSPHPSS